MVVMLDGSRDRFRLDSSLVVKRTVVKYVKDVNVDRVRGVGRSRYFVCSRLREHRAHVA